MKDKFKLIVSLVAIITIIIIGVGFSQQTPQPVIMSNCNGEDVEVTFRIPMSDALRVLGFEVDSDIVKDTGSAVVYIKSMDIYWVTKRDKESARYDGEIFKYVKSECLE